MAKKKKSLATSSVNFRVTLDINVNMGTLSLEDALAKARNMKPADVMDLKGLDLNDWDIKVAWLSQNDPE